MVVSMWPYHILQFDEVVRIGECSPPVAVAGIGEHAKEVIRRGTMGPDRYHKREENNRDGWQGKSNVPPNHDHRVDVIWRS